MLISKPLCTALILSLLSVAFFANAQDTTTPKESPQDFLVASAAADFAAHERTRPAKVKNVHLRYAEDENGKKTYMICGQFQTAIQAGTRGWTDFATLKTEGYEQWLGAQAAALCKNSRSQRGAPDLSAALQSKLVTAPPAAE